MDRNLGPYYNNEDFFYLDNKRVFALRSNGDESNDLKTNLCEQCFNETRCGVFCDYSELDIAGECDAGYCLLEAKYTVILKDLSPIQIVKRLGYEREDNTEQDRDSTS